MRGTNDLAVVAGVGNEEDEPVDGCVAAFEREAPEHGLDILEPRLGFDVDDLARAAVYAERVERTLVTGDGERDLEAPGPRRPKAVDQPPEQSPLSCIEARVPARVDAYRQIEPDGPGEPRQRLGGHAPLR